MTKTPPKIDTRTAIAIEQQVRQLLVDERLLGAYAQSFSQLLSDPYAQIKDPYLRALVSIFARFAELIIQRLNQVPDKSFLAFLDLLGASRLPPQSAKVPLTFFLAPGSNLATVPAGTQVAAPPTKEVTEPVIFETQRDLVITSAVLRSLWVRDPEQDQYANYEEVTTTSSVDVPLFRGNRQIEHILYIGDSKFLSFPNIHKLTLNVNLSEIRIDGQILDWQSWDSRTLEWQVWDGKTWITKTPHLASSDRNSAELNLAQQGDNLLVFDNDSIIGAVPLQSIAGEESRWLRCRLKTPIAIDSQTTRHRGMVRETHLPRIKSVSLTVELNRSNLQADTAFSNATLVDLSKPFFPFGEKPKFGDTFYLANAEAFSKSDSTGGANITLTIKLINPADLGIIGTAESNKIDPKLQWEFWNGTTWVLLGTSTRTTSTGPSGTPDRNKFNDETKALTEIGSEEKVTFQLPILSPDQSLQSITINGIENFWIRVRIINGDYGKEASYKKNDNGSYELQPASFIPPVIESLTIAYDLAFTPTKPEKILTYNDFTYRSIPIPADLGSPVFDPPFLPFEPAKNGSSNEDLTKPSAYLGFVMPTGQPFPNLPLSLFVQVKDFKYGEYLTPISPTQHKQVGNPGTIVTYPFVITNTTSQPVDFQFSMLAGATDNPWRTEVPAPLTVFAGQSQEITLRVTIPPNAPVGSRDRTFLLVTKANEPNNFYNAVIETIAGTQLPNAQRIQLTWQYWNGSTWNSLSVQDGTEQFTRSGLIEFLPPTDITPKADFDVPSRYWLRVQWDRGDYILEPRVERVLLNTTWANQTVTLRDEILGSSDGTEHQRFVTVRAPVLQGQQLQIREPELPTAEAQTNIRRDEGTDAIPLLSDPSQLKSEVWIRWHEVPDFYTSGGRDRHYVLDHLTGEIQFGDGINGLIPPKGVGNVRITFYQSGGGAIGNQVPEAIVQLKTTVPYVDKVNNLLAAHGGTDPETLDSVRYRVPRELRHGDRAATLEDYEDLAIAATPDVARAKCIPLLDLLKNDGLDIQNPADQPPKAPGRVSVIIVPHTDEPQPLPSLELLNFVSDYLKARSTPTTALSVVGPLYISVSIKADIALASLEGASTVKQQAEQTLANFLHPLTGAGGTGWDFGRKPHQSDFYSLLESIPGVDHIRSLTIDPPEDLESQPGNQLSEALQKVKQIIKTKRFLVYSGNHIINLLFETN